MAVTGESYMSTAHAADAHGRGWRRYTSLAALLFLLALFFSTVPSGFVYDSDEISQSLLTGNWFRRFQWMPLFLLANYLLWRRRDLAWSLARQINPFLLALIGFMLLSALWSPLPLVTARRVIFMVGVFLTAGTIFTTDWYPRRFLLLAHIAIAGMVSASVVAAVVFPGFGVHQEGAFAGLWHGICIDKNLLANLAGVGVLLSVHAWFTQPRHRVFIGFLVAQSVLALVMSGAKGSLVATVLATLFMALLILRPVTNKYWLPVVMVITLLTILIPLFFYSIVYGVPTYADIFGPFFDLLGKDLSLTGRDEIWVWLLPIISEHWLLGYGFGAFWVGDFGLSGEITESLGYYPYQAHNTFLEMLNELGVIGLMLLLGFLVTHAMQLFRLRQIDPVTYSFYLPLLVMVLIISVSESAIFGGGGLFTLILILSSLSTSRYLYARRAQ